MPETLDEVKERLKRNYLGKAQIHGLGLSRKQQTIKVYASSGGDPEQTVVLEEIQKAAKPFKVIVIWEDRPEVH